MLQIIQKLQAATPKWAAKAQIILATGFTAVVALQEAKVIDILPIDPVKREAIRGWVAVAAVVGGLYLSSRKTSQVTTTVTTPEIDLNTDLPGLLPKFKNPPPPPPPKV